jgi:hypothetical protein
MGSCPLTGNEISEDRNVITKQDENIIKYKDVVTQVQIIWNVKTKVLLIIKEAAEIISKSFIKYLSNITA